MSDLEKGENNNSSLPARFKLDLQQLFELNSAKDKQLEELAKLGGVKGIAEKISVNLETGLSDDDDIKERQTIYGRNEFKEPPTVTYWELLLNSLKEPILILLLVCAIIEIILGTTISGPENDPKTGWIDGTAILIAVLLVSNVTAGTDYDKEMKFRELNKTKNDRAIKVRRNGIEVQVQIGEIVVGDIVLLQTGDWIPADGFYIDGHGLATDESSMTGEADVIKKNDKKPFFLSGTTVAEGSGAFVVTAVGMNSEWGRTYEKMTEEREDTPLQESLGELAKIIGYAGMVIAALVFLVLIIQFLVENASHWQWDYLKSFLQFFTLSITIVVVAVPEGLPLAVTISLAYSMKAMLKDNNLVRHLDACETMGGATNICSDKTGTLTENRMTVTAGFFGNKLYEDRSDSPIGEQMARVLNKQFLELLTVGIATNSNAFLETNDKGQMKFVGSKTECALLVLAEKLKCNYTEVRKREKVFQIFPFSSAKKRMSTIISSTNGGVLHAKGASEIMLGLCQTYLDADCKLSPLTEDMKTDMLKNTIERLAAEGLRTLTLAYKELPELTEEFAESPDENLILIGIVGIQDPLRAEVPGAIRQCKAAGITVRMVTGDNKLTATRISTDCGILNPGEGEIIMEGPDFRKLSNEELDPLLPKLKVLARSSPSDKHRLVTRLKQLGEVVAVTGDGTNDAPALKAADVGFGMFTGTDIAKEAADIIIMDDNFASIVKAVMWGRCVRQNIQKFLQFQLTVNLVALTVVFIAAASGRGEPIKPIQFLWLNLIQDTLAALALATEQPTAELLNGKPAGRTERLITPTMWRNMVCTALYQIAILFMILYAGDSIWGLEPIKDPASNYKPTIQYTMLFNTFVLFQLFNEINCRLLSNDWNAFAGFFTNKVFISIVIGCLGLQIIFIQVGGQALGTVPLDVVQWFSCIGLAISVLIVGAFIRVVIPVPQWHWLKYQKVKVETDEESESKDDIPLKEVKA